MTTPGCHTRIMTKHETLDERFDHLRRVRAEAVEHARVAQRLARERRDLIQGLIDDGQSQADVARGLGVTRQAIQKMLRV
jgi:DNA invertase Pin-like site-specific DNA recombinase